MIGQDYVAFVLAWLHDIPSFINRGILFQAFKIPHATTTTTTTTTTTRLHCKMQDARCKCKTTTLHARKGGWVVTPEGEGFKRRECNLTWPWSSAQHGQWRWMALDATRWWTVDRGPWTVNTSHGTSLPPAYHQTAVASSSSRRRSSIWLIDWASGTGHRAA